MFDFRDVFGLRVNYPMYNERITHALKSMYIPRKTRVVYNKLIWNRARTPPMAAVYFRSNRPLSWYLFSSKRGSKVSRESDLRSVSYNRPVGVRSFVKNVKSLSENQHNS